MGNPIYLDHNATTPVDPEVVAAMTPFLAEIFGNPSSVDHAHGHAAQTAVEAARGQVAAVIGARAPEIAFTGSCTEANNLAILGAARAQPEKRHIVTTAIEHPSVLEPCRALAAEGYDLTVLPVDSGGRVSPAAVAGALRDDTVLVSVMGANNEVGVLQPLADIGAVCAARDVLFHSDLAQLVAYAEVDVEALGVHLASLSAHKVYGPKGVGALYARSRRPRARLAPLMYGGGQERGLRPGTLNTPGIVGMGAAFDIARRRRGADATRLRAMCERFRDELKTRVDGVELNGDPDHRLPNNLSFSIAGIEPLALIRRLNRAVSFSASSACSTDKVETSPVLVALFGDGARARGAFRVAPGRFTTKDDMDLALEAFVTQVNRLRGVVRSSAA